jgi:hypothetical protein
MCPPSICSDESFGTVDIVTTSKAICASFHRYLPCACSRRISHPLGNGIFRLFGFGWFETAQRNLTRRIAPVCHVPAPAAVDVLGSGVSSMAHETDATDREKIGWKDEKSRTVRKAWRRGAARSTGPRPKGSQRRLRRGRTDRDGSGGSGIHGASE